MVVERWTGIGGVVVVMRYTANGGLVDIRWIFKMWWCGGLVMLVVRWTGNEDVVVLPGLLVMVVWW